MDREGRGSRRRRLALALPRPDRVPANAVDEDDAVSPPLSVTGSRCINRVRTHSTAASIGRSGSYRSVKPAALIASSQTFIFRQPKKETSHA